MDYRYLGKSGLRVSAICLGAMNFGATTDEREARRIVDMARESGVNFIDTADAYNGGKSEEMVGALLADDRRDWILATKVGQQDGPPERKHGLSRKWMLEAIDRSLERLRTDHVDIYYMHHVDWDTPLGGKRRRDGRHRRQRQGPVLGVLQPPRLAGGRDRPALRPRWARRGRWWRSRSTTSSTGSRSPTCCRPASITVSGSPPTRRWRAAC